MEKQKKSRRGIFGCYNDNFGCRNRMLFTGFGAAVILIFSIVNLIAGQFTSGITALVLCVVGFLSLPTMSRRGGRSALSRIAVYGFFLFCIYLYGSGTTASFSWFLLLPIVAFFLEGGRSGLVVTALFLVASITISLLHFGGQLPTTTELLDDRSSMVLFHLAYLVGATLLYLIYRTLATAERQLQEKQEEIARLNRHVEYYTYYDPLTGVFNRRQIIAELTKEVERCRRHPEQFSILLLDVDYFKQINDSYGQPFGDYILKQTAISLNNVILRQSDSIGRYGGEEFLILLPDTSLEGGEIAGERIRSFISLMSFHNSEHNESVPLSVSCGVAELQENEDQEILLRKADQALNQAKANGRNQVRVCKKVPVEEKRPPS